jgi:hypothetical protein
MVMTEVRMRKTWAGPDRVVRAGACVSVPIDVAKRLVESHQAEFVRQEPAEVAVKEPLPETAVSETIHPAGKQRGGGRGKKGRA